MIAGDWGALEVPGVPRYDETGTAGARRRHLHCVLEVGHPQAGSIVDRVCATVCDSHEANEFADECARIRTAPRRRDEVVEVRQGMPRDERSLRPRLQAIEQFRGRVCERLAVERHVDKYVRVDKDHRYFRAKAS